jgi:hypothetical protein
MTLSDIRDRRRTPSRCHGPNERGRPVFIRNQSGVHQIVNLRRRIRLGAAGHALLPSSAGSAPLWRETPTTVPGLAGDAGCRARSDRMDRMLTASTQSS